jgi:putative component of membrane protein insertase Oxa1/YidC/SpoIIIJ protein YidD
MTPHLLDLEKCVSPEGALFVLVIHFYNNTISNNNNNNNNYYYYYCSIYTSILCQIIPFWDALRMCHDRSCTHTIHDVPVTPVKGVGTAVVQLLSSPLQLHDELLVEAVGLGRRMGVGRDMWEARVRG